MWMRRGTSLVEALAVSLILAFVMAASARLLHAGNVQQLLSRGYSQAQTDLRDALRRATRGIRHAFGVVPASSSPTFSAAPNSNASQLIVRLPQPGSAAIEARYYLSNGTFYVQRDTDAAPGTPLITGVTQLQFQYLRVSATTHTDVTGSPGSANEVRIRLTARRETATTPVEALVSMRNSVIGTL